MREIAEVDKLQALPQLLAALAQVCGQLCKPTQLGAQIGLDGKTVSRDLMILEQLFLVRRVPAGSGKRHPRRGGRTDYQRALSGG